MKKIYFLFMLLIFPVTVIAAEFTLYVFNAQGAADDIAVILDGERLGVTDTNGKINARLHAGVHQVMLKTPGGKKLAEFGFNSNGNESADASVTLYTDAEPVIAVNSFADSGNTATTGLLRGQIVSLEDEMPLTAAIISIPGLNLTLKPDNQGNYEIKLPRGNYDVEVSAPGFANRNLQNISITGNVVSEITIHLSKKLDMESIDEVKVIGTYTPDLVAGVQLERDSEFLVDAIDTEQLKRFGGSTAASALSRIAGVSLNQGRYVVVRGLNERHSTVTLNGSSLPSPDPSRRVVPLDIFPAMVLQAIEVQKTSTPNQPADSTGGIVKLKTKTYPDEFKGDLSLTVGYTEDLTGVSRMVQPGESDDATGYGADARSLPGAARHLQELDIQGTTTTQDRVEAGLALSPQAMKTEQRSADPDLSLELGIGDTLGRFDSGLDLGYLLSLRYENSWNHENSERRNYVLGSGTEDLNVRDEIDYGRTENNIDLSAVLSFGISWEGNQIDSNTFLLRQSQAETNVATGPQGDNRDLSVRTTHRWNEREFSMQQFVGEHDFEVFGGTHLQWDLAASSATLDSPDQREYLFSATSPENDPDVTLDDIRYTNARRQFLEIQDDNLSYGLNFTNQIYEGKSALISLNYGGSYFDRERDGETLRFLYQTMSGGMSGLENESRIEDIINASTLSEERFLLSTNTLPTDKYDAAWEIAASFLAVSTEFHDVWKFQLGARAEDSNLVVNTFVDAPGDAIPLQAELYESDVFPSVNLSYSINDDLQLRAGFNTSKNRPDFRELSNAEYIDPATGDNFRGNPRLESAEIDNFDMRAEWYISDYENLTFAYFRKEFEQPIEKTVSRIGGGGELFSFQNADTGQISGWEIDFRKEFAVADYNLFVSGNASFVDSRIVTTVSDQTVSRSMQGQPDSLFNFQLGLDSDTREYTLAVLRMGESIDSVSSGMPPIVRQPRTDMDFKFAQYLDAEKSYKLKAALKNLLNEPYEFTQGGEPFRRYSNGLAAEIGIGMDF